MSLPLVPCEYIARRPLSVYELASRASLDSRSAGNLMLDLPTTVGNKRLFISCPVYGILAIMTRID